MANNRDKEQRAHQRELKKLDFEEARQQRLQDDRIKVYIEFARLTFTYKTTNPAAIVDILGAFSDIELLVVNPETKDAADKIRAHLIELRKIAADAQWDEDKGGMSTTDVGHSLVVKKVLEIREVFLRAARNELEVESS